MSSFVNGDISAFIKKGARSKKAPCPLMRQEIYGHFLKLGLIVRYFFRLIKNAFTLLISAFNT